MERVYTVGKDRKKQLDELLAKDPYAPISFGRISPVIKEIGDSIFIYVKSEEDAVFKFVEEQVKTIEGQQAKKEEEERVIDAVHKDEEAAAGGFGNIFG